MLDRRSGWQASAQDLPDGVRGYVSSYNTSYNISGSSLTLTTQRKPHANIYYLIHTMCAHTQPSIGSSLALLLPAVSIAPQDLTASASPLPSDRIEDRPLDCSQLHSKVTDYSKSFTAQLGSIARQGRNQGNGSVAKNACCKIMRT